MKEEEGNQIERRRRSTRLVGPVGSPDALFFHETGKSAKGEN